MIVDQTMELPYPSGLAGSHQERNARTALVAIRALQKQSWRIEEEHIRTTAKVVTNTGLLGRWQVLAEPPLTIADVAHNVDGLRIVKEMLDRLPYEQLHIVFGAVNDKDLGRVAELPTNAIYYFCKADIPRGLDAANLAEQASAHGLRGAAYASVEDAYKAT